MPRRTLFLLILLLITLPLALASAQDQEEEWLKAVHAAFLKSISLETQRIFTDGLVILTYRISILEGMPANAFRVYMQFTDDSRRQFELGSVEMYISDIFFELGILENLNEEDEATVSMPSNTSTLKLQSALVKGQACITNAIAEGPLASDLLLEINATLQDVQSQLELHEYLTQSIVEDPDGWILDLVELPTERTDDQELRVFSFTLEPKRYISYMLSTGDLIPPELNQFKDLLDEFFADVYESFQLEWKIWINVENGYINHEKMQNSLTSVLDGLDMPEFGTWMEIDVTGSIEIHHSDHNQLTDADFVLPCIPR